MTNEKYIRRSGIKIMASLITLLGSLAYIMILAVINGSVGFIVAMGVTLMGAVGIAKSLGEAVPLSYGAIIALTIGFGVLRGFLRYLERIQVTSSITRQDFPRTAYSLPSKT